MEWHWVYLWGIAVWVNYAYWLSKGFFDGSDRFRHGELMRTATGECETPQDWGSPVVEATLLNANASNDEVFALAA